MVHHGEEKKHHLVLSYADLSVWCYACDQYIHHQVSPLTHPYMTGELSQQSTCILHIKSLSSLLVALHSLLLYQTVFKNLLKQDSLAKKPQDLCLFLRKVCFLYMSACDVNNESAEQGSLIIIYLTLRTINCETIDLSQLTASFQINSLITS